MIVYNVSLKVQPDIIESWIPWMKEIHLPEVLSTGCFLRCDFYQLHVQEEDGGLMFVVQYQCPDIATLEHYQEKYGPALREKTEQEFGGKYMAFRTSMETLCSFSVS